MRGLCARLFLGQVLEADLPWLPFYPTIELLPLLANLLCVCAVSPVHDAVFVQVLHRRQDLTGVASHLPLLQPLPLTDPVHQVSSGTQLHGHVVAVLCLQSLTHTQLSMCTLHRQIN